MLKVDPLVDLFFKDLSFPERMQRIAECGYRYVETWQGNDGELLKQMAEAGRECGVELISIVLNGPGNPAISPVDRATHTAFLEQVDRYSDHALAAGCARGIVTVGETLPARSAEEQMQDAIEVIRKAGETAARKGFMLNVEPLNTRVDHAGYFLDSPSAGLRLVKAVGLENVRLLYDIYHMEIMTGNQTVFIQENIDWIGHFHAAGVPGRHELFHGETHYPFLVRKIEEAGYEGFFGLEYMPQMQSRESLVKTRTYLEEYDERAGAF